MGASKASRSFPVIRGLGSEARGSQIKGGLDFRQTDLFWGGVEIRIIWGESWHLGNPSRAWANVVFIKDRKRQLCQERFLTSLVDNRLKRNAYDFLALFRGSGPSCVHRHLSASVCGSFS